MFSLLPSLLIVIAIIVVPARPGIIVVDGFILRAALTTTVTTRPCRRMTTTTKSSTNALTLQPRCTASTLRTQSMMMMMKRQGRQQLSSSSSLSSSINLLGGEAMDDDSNKNNSSSTHTEEGIVITTPSSSPPPPALSADTSSSSSLLAKLKSKLSNRDQLSKMGLSVLLSYGFVSNMSYAISISIAWYIFNIKYKISPLAPNQWKSYLLVYSGFYIFNSVIRPVRVGIAAIISHYFEVAIQYIQDQTQLRRKYCIGILVFITNVVGTLLVMSCGICIASLASGVPIFP
jgi:hypothetical protein